MEYPYGYIYKPFHHRMRKRENFFQPNLHELFEPFLWQWFYFPWLCTRSHSYFAYTLRPHFSLFLFHPACHARAHCLRFFFVIWNIVLYRIIFHSLLLTFIPRYIQFFYYSAFCRAPPPLSLSLAPFTWLCYNLHSTLNNIKQPLSYMNEYGTMKSWKKSLCGNMTMKS